VTATATARAAAIVRAEFAGGIGLKITEPPQSMLAQRVRRTFNDLLQQRNPDLDLWEVKTARQNPARVEPSQIYS
jgi:hypothetical protein